MRVRNSKIAMSIMEVMVSVVIIGIVASFGIPTYKKTMEKQREKRAAVKLRLIASGMEMFRARNGFYPVRNGDLSGLPQINAALGLNLIDDVGGNYTCRSNINPDGFNCLFTTTGYPAAGTWGLHVTSSNGMNHAGDDTPHLWGVNAAPSCSLPLPAPDQGLNGACPFST